MPLPGAVPRHIAIIMDGNNRWAKLRGMSGSAGHRAGAKAVSDIVDACYERGVEVLTLYAFSNENWSRPIGEVRALMTLFYHYLSREVGKLQHNHIRVRFIGRRDRLDIRLQALMAESEERTRNNLGKTLVVAIDYGGRWDITQAVQRLVAKVGVGKLQSANISEKMLSEYISLADLPPPDLCIRTGGEKRVSNFLLWQCAYTEFYFTEVLWPDIDRSRLDTAIADYSARERRFGSRGEPNHPGLANSNGEGER